MDAGIVGSVVTVLFFVLFVLIIWWAFRRDNKQKFNDAANLPFQEDAKDTRDAGHSPN
jgi:cytochrome c oxidase cbb3-type subunit 4